MSRTPRVQRRLRRTGCLSILLSAMIVLACGSQPIPLTAQAGTTFVLMVPNDFMAGFGRGWTGVEDGVYPPTGPPLRDPGSDPNDSPDPSLEDLQRGELFINAIDPNDPNNPHPTVYRFPVRYITSVGPAGISDAALSKVRAAQDPNHVIVEGADQAFWAGQIIAFIDIPVGVPGDAVYDLYPQLVRRKVSNKHEWDIDAMQDGWNSALPIRLKILPGDGSEHYSSLAGADGTGWTSVVSELELLVPHSELRIELETYLGGGYGYFRPAAAEIDLLFKAGTISVAGVALGKNDPSSAIVRWEIEPDPASPPDCDATQILRIHLIDPDILTGWLRVAFHHHSPSTCPERVSTSDFTILDSSIYTASGVEITIPTYHPTIHPEIH